MRRIEKGHNETWLTATLRIARKLKIENEAKERYLHFIFKGYSEPEAAYYSININEFNNTKKEDSMSNLETSTNNINLADALSAITQTKNGALSNATTFSKCLNFFFHAPMMSKEDAVKAWEKAYSESPLIATKLCLWLRDPRNGAGKRDSARAIFSHMEANDFSYVNIWEHIPTYGRYDDLLSLQDSVNFDSILSMWARDIQNGNKLAAKWMPRERSSQKAMAKRIAKSLGFSLKEYRKWLANNTAVVETQMCSKQWSDIIYSHVPSQCHNKNKNAFQRNDNSRYSEFIEKVNEGKDTVNTGTLWPHQIIGDIIATNFDPWGDDTIETESPSTKMLWDNQNNWVDNCPTIVVCDTSASMFSTFSKKNDSPGVIAIALALYTAERLNGPYKDKFMTFSSSAKWVETDSKTSIAQRVKSIPSIVENTNIQSVFDLILNTAKLHSVRGHQMPSRVVIISDMQFDVGANPNTTNFKEIKAKYAQYGYTMPSLVFWNVSGEGKDFPVTIHDSGTALVSGYSPSIMKAIVNNDLTPMAVMMEAIKYINI